MSNRIDGRVATIGESGNLVTDIPVSKISDLPSDETAKIKFSGHETLGVYPAQHDQPPGTLVASCGESGFLEIEIVGISLGEMLGIKPETPVIVTWA